MNRLKLFFAAVAFTFFTIFTTACSGDIGFSPKSAQTEIPIALINWSEIYKEILAGQNELNIDFNNYNIEDEGDVTKIRQYRGCGLYDLDASGVPELFISVWLYEGGFCYVFTADSGGGVYVGEAEGAMVEKSTGVLFGVAGESGYTPDIAYEYKTDNPPALSEIEDYIKPVTDTAPYDDYSLVKLGGKTIDVRSDEVAQIEIYDSFEEALENYSQGVE